jgi:hypothetical protein
MAGGDGTFDKPPALMVGKGPSSVVSGDFDADPRTDLAVANGGEGTVLLLLGRGGR